MKALKIGFLALFSSILSASVAEEFHFQSSSPNLSEIYLQMARSIEATEHIGPYIHHVLSEHERVSRLYEAKLRKKLVPYLPAHITAEYVTNLLASWDNLSPKLNLPKMARKSGEAIRIAIDGEQDQGTSLRLIFNWHQRALHHDMSNGGKRDVGFAQLKDELIRLARDGENPFLVMREDALSDAERGQFLALIQKPRFTKSDFPALGAFYEGPHDRLSDIGKSILSARVAAGQNGQDVTPTDAQKYARELSDMFQSIFRQLHEQLPQDEAERYKEWISHIIEELGRLAEVEIQLAIVEQDLRRS